MADDAPKSAGWTVPTRPSGDPLDIMFANVLAGGRIPYASLGAQIYDARMNNRTLTGAPGGPYSDQKYNNISRGLLGHPYSTGGGTPWNPTGTGGGGTPPPPGGGTTPPPPPGGPVTTTNPGGPNTPATTVFQHGNDPAGTGNNQWGPYAAPAAGVGNWQAAVNKAYGPGDPVALLTKALGLSTFQFGGKTYQGSTTANSADIRRTLLAAGADPYAAAKIDEMMGGSGQGALDAATALGLGDRYAAAGQNGFRIPFGLLGR